MEPLWAPWRMEYVSKPAEPGDGECVFCARQDCEDSVMRDNHVVHRTERIFVRAGPQRITAAFLKRFEGPVEDLMSPHEWSLADKKIGYSYGITTMPHLRDLVIGGPYDVDAIPVGVLEHRLEQQKPHPHRTVTIL